MAALTIGLGMFGLSLMLAWTNSAMRVLHSDQLVYSGWNHMLGLQVRSRRTLVMGGLTLLFLALTVGFCATTGLWRQPFGWAMLGLMALARQWQIEEWSEELVVGLGNYNPTAAVLLGFLVASGVVAVVAPEWSADAAGWNAGCGVMAASWGLAAFAKYRASGVRWASVGNIALLVRERSYTGPKPLMRLRRWASGQKALCLTAAYMGFWGEAAGLAFVVPGLRWPVALASVVFQLGLMLLMGYYEAEWLLVMLSMAVLGQAELVP